MRLVTFESGSNGAGPRAGALLPDGRILDLQAAHVARSGRREPALESVLAIVEAGAGIRELIGDLLDAHPAAAHIESSAVRLLAPIPRPLSLRDFVCFEKHIRQAFARAKVRAESVSDGSQRALAAIAARFEIPPGYFDRPWYYRGNHLTVCGTETEIEWPAYSSVADFELEWGCFVGKAGKDIPRERAAEHIFGYTIFNDLSARDEQLVEAAGKLSPGKGKDFDRSNPMGPCLVTADELADPYALAMTVRWNGEEYGRGSTGDMHFRFEDLIAHASRSETLYPGEFLASGTVGDGSGTEHGRYLADGDRIELEVEGIGVLATTVRIASPPTERGL